MIDVGGTHYYFWRARDTITGKEQNFRTRFHDHPPSFEAMRQWVQATHRHAELLEYRPWNAAEDGHRILYRVPIQFVNWFVKKPDLAQPDPRRISRSLFSQRPLGARPLGGRPILKGV